MTVHDAGPTETSALDDAPEKRSLLGLHDLVEGISSYRLWSMLGWNDIRQRYRRSTLGPWWITISMGLFIVLLGLIYSKLFDQDIAFYLPYIALGMITWGFISNTIIESCNSFIDGTGIIKQIRLPHSLFPIRMIWRSLIVFLHTAVAFIPIALFFRLDLGVGALMALPGLALVVANQIWLSIVIGIVSTRYRDVPPLVQTIIPISMFATPIMWPASALKNARYVADLNPFYHLIQLVRAPLLGEQAALESWIVVGSMCIFGYALAAALLTIARKRLVYWL
jgi:ABC-type polysaccharide/polyol phosphate export permease